MAEPRSQRSPCCKADPPVRTERKSPRTSSRGIDVKRAKVTQVYRLVTKKRASSDL
ncbi:uncharacterized protein FRV6_08060 [Fusarium oxysporum]|uniref:Uncharacterized protein n=1 Tax=Fusarium oxysporum TaxID=5507 RepID=A0A2H3T5G7_FUSOX|nr:uncharacterized protein FRV6_08060 [Fusarium oxysporum]